MNYQNNSTELIKKIYLLRINMILYHAFYGMLCMNFEYYFDEDIDSIKIEDLKIKINPLVVKNKNLSELEKLLIEKLCKYLDKLKVYNYDYGLNEFDNYDYEELNEIEKEYMENEEECWSEKDIKNSKNNENNSKESKYDEKSIDNVENDENENIKNNKANKNNTKQEENIKTNMNIIIADMGKSNIKSENGKNNEYNENEVKKKSENNKASNMSKWNKNSENYRGSIEIKEKEHNEDNRESRNEARSSNHNKKNISRSIKKQLVKRKLRKHLQQKIYNIVKIMKESRQCGDVPFGAVAIVKKKKKKEIYWKEVLKEFIQFDVNDYSFMPPDRRYDDTNFFLPDYNDEIEKVENILFMIDASGSMSDKLVSIIFKEIKNCIDEFNGRVKGYVGSFDTNVYNVVPFEDKGELDRYKIRGRGSTSFINIFKYIYENMKNIDLKLIVILTDGYAPYPNEFQTRGKPILWIVTNEVSKPNIGKVLRINDNVLLSYEIG